jgi:hypothetical protein
LLEVKILQLSTSQFNYDSSGKRSRDFGAVGALGNLDPNTDDLEIVQGTRHSDQLISPEGRGWQWRECEISRNLVILNTPGIGESERRAAVIKLGHFFAFEIWKLQRIDSQLKYWEGEKVRFETMLRDHENNWP